MYIQILVSFTFTSATADFFQNDAKMGSNVAGVLQSNGDFLFYIDHDMWRKIVMVTNLGIFIRRGYVPQNAANWQDVYTWRSLTRWTVYNLKNFQGSKGSDFFLVLMTLI